MATLSTTRLGRTDLFVTRLGYGSLNLGGPATRGGRYVAPEIADRVLNTVVDSGINFIDTAPDYGEAEESIGRHLSHRREEFILASKCSCPVGASAELPIPADRQREHFHTRENIRAGVEQSLRRMRTDHLDLVEIHGSPSRAELEANDSVAELLKLKLEGKVRFIGMSATLPHVLEHLEMGVFDVFQMPYSALQLEHADVIGQAAAGGAGVVVRGGVAQGSIVLSPEAAPGHRRDQVRVQRDIWDRAGLDEILDGMSPMEFVLRFTLSHPGVSTAIVGTASVEHLTQNVAAASRGPLPDGLYLEAQRRLRLAASAA